ncbi:DUF5686 family protein [Antarcticibacterium sp. 1MA-6-2]|uniref:DUF5686 and carboxypeptidase-like regulatory domain-containing protein n=1 Tax=Antarcticibacterium sp. 1MA-6-2 TaxID=2908210 RepID=UPI002882E104|nr:DUF5686 family protein [Antarcticibacterium sp. 1MA-6-2]
MKLHLSLLDGVFFLPSMKQFFLCSFLLLSFFSSLAQTRISGEIVDEAGEPVAFANVIFLNSSVGTVSSEDGKFYLTSTRDYKAVEFSFVGYEPLVLQLKEGDNLNLKVVLKEDQESLQEVYIMQGKTSKKNNPAIDILRKIWENRRQNGVNKFDQYEYRKYEKLEFDVNTIDSSFINNKIFNGLEFIFEDLDTNAITGKTYLPIFLNESVLQVYGDNKLGKKREDLIGNKNSGFNNNQILIESIKDLYFEIDVYENYLRIFDKNFISPLSTTGIDNYNYVLADSSMIDNKWLYNIVYYPRLSKMSSLLKGIFG